MKRLLQPPPFQDEEQQRLARILYILLSALLAAAAILLGLFWTGDPYWPGIIGMLIGIGVGLAAVVMVRAGRLQLAGLATLLALTGVVTYLVVASDGLHDVGLMAFPVILVAAALLVTRRMFIALSLFVILVAAVIGASELAGWLTNPFSATTSLDDVAIVVVVLVLTALTARLLADNLMHSLERLRHELAERQQSEARRRTLLAAIPDLIFQFDAQGRFTDYHPSQSLPALPSQAFVGKLVEEVLPPDIARQTHAAIEAVLATGGEQTFEYSLPGASGTRTFEARLVPGGADQILSLSRDITQRRRIETQLRETELRFRTLVEQIPAVTFILSPDNPAQTLYVSPQIESILGFTPEEWAADPTRWEQQVHPDDRPWAATTVSKMHTTGEPYAIDYRIFDKSGRVRWLHSEARPIRDDSGRHVFSLGIDLDITGQKQAEEMLRRRADQLALLNEVGRAVASLRGLPDLFEGIYQQVKALLPLDAFFIMLYEPLANEITFPLMYDGGRRYEEPGGPLSANTAVARVISGREPVLILLKPEQLEAAMTPESMVGDVARPSASLLYVPLLVEDRVLGVLSIQSYEFNAYAAEDVDLLTGVGRQAAVAIENARLFAEASRLIQELEAKNTELERFTYTVSHDLKSPLITIRGYLSFLEQDAVAGNLDRLRSDLNRVSEATHKMQRLMEELLELSRIGRIMNPPQAVALGSLAREAAELLHGVLTPRRVEVVVAPDLPTVSVDRVRLLEVFQNLIENAAKFMGDQLQPRIEIGARAGPDETVVFVRDNGQGIDPQYHGKIFGLFDKLDPHSEGTGVGLALVRRIIEVHGGRIWVESDGAGRGATFCFTLGARRAVR